MSHPDSSIVPPLTITFGSFADGEKICGRYHAPSAPLREGVVLCNPSGVEDIWTYAMYRKLAEQLAARGFPVLRFDYHGQGDSSGDDRSPNRVQAWKDSVAFAIDELVARSGVASVTLFGLRLGATLATTVAAERGGVARLALWAPLAGRAFVRELRAYRMLNPPAPAPPRLALHEGDDEAAGFLIARETIASLGELDLTKIDKKPAERALVLSKDETSNEEKVTKRLESLGVEVTQRRVPGYAAMMLEPRKSTLPEEAIEALTSWICDLPKNEANEGSSAPRASTPAALVTRAPYASREVREEALRFGPEDRLFGVVTEPVEQGPRAKTALLLLTVAAHHHVGANRMYVALAREAAARGFSALRFDIAGVGESISPTGAPPHPYAFEPVEDVVSAMDALARRGVTRFVLAGLCSGAFLAYHATLADPRVDGVVLLNPQVFYFKEGDSLDIKSRSAHKSMRTYRALLFSPTTWKRLAKGEVNVRLIAGMMLDRAKRLVETRAEDALERLRGGASKAPNIRRDFETICGRGSRALLVFSAEDEGIDFIEAHLGKDCKAMQGAREFEVQLIEGPDHTFAPVWSQQRVNEILCEHLERHFG